MGDKVNKALLLDIERNTVDLYLDDLYRNELLFKIENEETDFIQSGIETIVTNIEKLLRELGERMIQNEVETIRRDFPERRVSSNGDSDGNCITKIGSFYEDTKNGFPDEFEYIFILCSFESDKTIKSQWNPNRDILKFHSFLDGFLSLYHEAYRAEFMFQTSTQRVRYVCFDKYLERKGPSSRLRFIYQNSVARTRYIYVNIVPGFKVTEVNLDEEQTKHNGADFAEEVKRAGSIILVNGNVSLVETEVHCMKNVLSAKHIKVYMVLKHLMNCSNNSEFLEIDSMTGSPVSNECLISSYMIKRAVILHHYKCTHADDDDISCCFLVLLNCLHDTQSDTLTKTVTKPTLRRTNGRLDMLGNMLEKFEAMRKSQTLYNYERCSSFVRSTAPSLECFPREKDSQKEEAIRKRDWFQVICTYLMNFILIALCCTFGIFMIHALSRMA